MEIKKKRVLGKHFGNTRLERCQAYSLIGSWNNEFKRCFKDQLSKSHRDKILDDIRKLLFFLKYGISM